MASVPATIAVQAEIIPVNYFTPLDLDTIYGRRAPLEVDLGCGDGLFIAAAGAANPSNNFLGVERMPGRVRSACRKVEVAGLRNTRVLEIEISYAVEHLLPAASVSVFHLMFPDPWPKRRHSPRRIFTGEFLGSLHRALVPDGTLRIATDQTDYFQEIERVAARSPGFRVTAEDAATCLVSTFEKRFRQDGMKIHRQVLRKVSPLRNPDASQ